jgi:hypothetical protein
MSRMSSFCLQKRNGLHLCNSQIKQHSTFTINKVNFINYFLNDKL